MVALDDLKKQAFLSHAMGAESPYRKKFRRVHLDSENTFFPETPSPEH